MHERPVDRLCLGTAQFGMDYGIANKIGKPSKNEVFEILRHAGDLGIDMLDTAHEYGNSEELIGEYIGMSGVKFRVISKMPKQEKGVSDPKIDCKETIGRLRVTELEGYLVRSSDVKRYDELYKQLSVLKESGLAGKIGASLYMAGELDHILERDLAVEIVQVPYNIFDRRFERYFPLLKKRGIEVYARSVFLQGLFFLDEAKMNKDFNAAAVAAKKLRDIAGRENIPVSALCLCFVMLNSSVDRVIVGVDSLAQLKENIAALGYIDETRRVYNDLKSLELEAEEVILPYNWK